jgi:N-acetylglutamate synthase-like GNAT family acetyltransferase
MKLPQTTQYILRPARETDDAAIKQLIRSVGINPMDLDWRRFLVAVDEQEQVIATGQVKPHNKGVILELASIAVVEEHRGQGLARAIIEQLLQDHPRPLYLTCRSTLQPFYQKFGFRSLTYEEMPRFYQRLSKLAGVFITITRQDKSDGLSVMKLQ